MSNQRRRQSTNPDQSRYALNCIIARRKSVKTCVREERSAEVAKMPLRWALMPKYCIAKTMPAISRESALSPRTSSQTTTLPR